MRNHRTEFVAAIIFGATTTFADEVTIWVGV